MLTSSPDLDPAGAITSRSRRPGTDTRNSWPGATPLGMVTSKSSSCLEAGAACFCSFVSFAASCEVLANLVLLNDLIADARDISEPSPSKSVSCGWERVVPAKAEHKRITTAKAVKTAAFRAFPLFRSFSFRMNAPYRAGLMVTVHSDMCVWPFPVCAASWQSIADVHNLNDNNN